MCPYIKEYTDLIMENGDTFDLVYWDRDAKFGATDADFGNSSTKTVLNHLLTNKSNVFRKLVGYIRATRFIKKTIKSNNYHGVIFLQSHGAVLCSKIVRKKYSNRFIVDVRDFTLENHRFYKRKEEKLFKQAYAIIISSPAYACFLPKQIDYVVAHNFVPLKNESSKIQINHSKLKFPISISFVGTVRFIGMDIKILNLFKNDNRFLICYYGSGSDTLKEYCEKNQIKNVDFHGRFNPDETLSFYSKTNIINNLYGNSSPFLDYALSNKLYHSAQLLIPILVCPDTYMEEITKKYNLGFVLDVNNESSPDILFKQYEEFDYSKMKSGADFFLKNVREDNRKWKECISSFLKSRD